MIGVLDAFGGRATRFGYSNARVKAMKTALLGRPALEQMIGAKEMAEVLAALKETPYEEDLGESSLGHSGADLIEFALSRHFARSARKIIGFTPRDALGTVMSVLEKWDAYNLRVILLGKHLGHPNADIAPLLVPAGEFAQAELKRMQEQPDVESVARLVSGTGYGKALAPLLDEYRRSREIQPLLNAVDKEFYGQLPKRISGTQRDERAILGLVKAVIDGKNIMVILRGKRAGIPPEALLRYCAEGGNITAPSLRALANRGSVEEVVAGVKGKYNLEAALARYGADSSLSHFEIELERRIAEKGLRTLRTSVLSAGAIVGYLYLKETEISNLRKIVRAKEFNLPADKLRETIVFMPG